MSGVIELLLPGYQGQMRPQMCEGFLSGFEPLKSPLVVY